ncbi:MAG: 6-carboxytetrahydropterin synthase [Bacteroidales bacterium]|nr:6-carboxytetrahydropterin synthase [Bacteroidales bacterium]
MEKKKIRLTKQFGFESAHALYNYDGKCCKLHGHSYKLFVTVIGYPDEDENSPKYGMVMDFGLLKEIVNEEIINKYDHSVMLNERTKAKIDTSDVLFSNVVKFKNQPTCENMLIMFAEKIKSRLPEGVDLLNLKLYETSDSFAEWNMND